MDDIAAVQRDGLGADECGELSGRVAPQEIHLKKAILAMRETEGPHRIGLGGGLDRDHPGGVALQLDGGGQAVEGLLTVEGGQALLQGLPDPAEGAEAEEHEEAGKHAGHPHATREGTGHQVRGKWILSGSPAAWRLAERRLCRGGG